MAGWHIDTSHNWLDIRDSDGKIVANLGMASNPLREESPQHAALIAAAPDLLALSKRMAKILVELDNFYPTAMPDDIDELIIGAADTIARAEGG